MSVFDRAQAGQLVAEQMTNMLAHARVMEPFMINGATFGPDQIVPLLVIDPNNLDLHMAQVSGWIGYWGGLSASAKKAHDKYEARYRAQRDGFISSAPEPDEAPTEAPAASGKGKGPKAAKAKSKTALEAEWRTMPGYIALYDQLADLEFAWSCAAFVYEALLRKGNMLTALGKLYGDEQAAPGAGNPHRAR